MQNISEHKHIALYGPNFGAGGAGRLHSYLAESLCVNDYCLDIVIHSDLPTGTYLPTHLTESVCDLRSYISVGNISGRYINQVINLYGLARYINAKKPSVIVSSMTKHNITALAAKYVSNYSPKVICIEQNVLSPETTKRPKLLLPLVSYLYALSDQVVAVSSDVSQDLTGLAKLDTQNIKVIPNCVDVQRIISEARKPVDSDVFSDNTPVILSVGSIDYQKNYGILIESFAMLNRKYNAKLVILGDGPRRLKIENLASKKSISQSVHFMGKVENPFKYMSRSNALVLSSRYEGLPMVVLESLASGTPAIVANTPGGASDVVDDGEHGVVVQSYEPEQFAKAMYGAINRSWNTSELVSRAKKYDKEKITNEYIRLIE